MKLLLFFSAFAFLIAAAPQALALEVGDKVPCVHANHINADGTESNHCVAEKDAETQKVTILEFFSTTCGFCHQNLPKVSALAEKLKEVATTRLVGLDRNEQAIREYIKKYSNLIKFSVALDSNREVSKAYDIKYTPTMFIIAGDKVIYKHVGVLSEENVKEIADLVSSL